MDFCILGVLLHAPQTLYDMKLTFESSLSLFYSASLGSIQTTLAKLLQNGLIEIASQQTQGRRKRVYRVSAAGRERFFAMMHEPLPLSRLEETALARYFFLGLVESRQERIAILTLIVKTAEAVLAELENNFADYNSREMDAEYRRQAQYRLATLDYGIMAHRNGIDWFRDVLRKEIES